MSGIPLLEVQITAGDGVQWLREVSRRWPVRPRIRLCRPLVRNPAALLQVVEMAGSPGDLEEIERYLLESKQLREVSVVRLSPSRRLVRGISDLPHACGMVLKSGAICTSCRYLAGPDGTHADRWSLLLPRSPQISKLIASLREAAGERGPRVYRARSYHPEQSLTPRQSAAIETAYRLGFYAFPRRTNLQEIARILGISRPAAAELLRRAEGKLLDPALSSV